MEIWIDTPLADPIRAISEVIHGNNIFCRSFFPQALATVGDHMSRKESIHPPRAISALFRPVGISVPLNVHGLCFFLLFAEGHKGLYYLLPGVITIVGAIHSEITK